MLKSRSSRQLDVAAEGLLSAPIPVSSQNCGAIKMTKTYKHAASGSGDHPQAGVTFTLGGVDQAVTDEYGERVLRRAGAERGSTPSPRRCPRATSPTTASSRRLPTTRRHCSDDPYTGETLDFHNTPKTNVSISVDSQIAGGTSSTVNSQQRRTRRRAGRRRQRDSERSAAADDHTARSSSTRKATGKGRPPSGWSALLRRSQRAHQPGETVDDPGRVSSTRPRSGSLSSFASCARTAMPCPNSSGMCSNIFEVARHNSRKARRDGYRRRSRASTGQYCSCAARRRRASVRSSTAAICGSLRRSFANAVRPITITVTAPAAVMSADLGAPSSRAISPK